VRSATYTLERKYT